MGRFTSASLSASLALGCGPEAPSSSLASPTSPSSPTSRAHERTYGKTTPFGLPQD